MKDKISILKELKALLIKHFGEDINDVILFGSQATGKAHEHSDYDVLIVLKNDYDWQYRDRIRNVIYEMELKHDIFWDNKIISLNELHHTLKGKYPLFTDALQQGIYA